MAEKIKDVKPPRGFSRLMWRAPIWFYRLGLGGLLGDRFVLVNHIGRKTGKLRQAVVEVVQHNKDTGTYVVVSGFGEKADWYQNVMAHPEINIQIARKKMAARAIQLPLPQAVEVMLDYNHRHPTALRTLARFLGYSTDGSDKDVCFFAGVVPMIALLTQNKG